MWNRGIGKGGRFRRGSLIHFIYNLQKYKGRDQNNKNLFWGKNPFKTTLLEQFRPTPLWRAAVSIHYSARSPYMFLGYCCDLNDIPSLHRLRCLTPTHHARRQPRTCRPPPRPAVSGRRSAVSQVGTGGGGGGGGGTPSLLACANFKTTAPSDFLVVLCN